MGLLNYFKSSSTNKDSAKEAKERLLILVSHERGTSQREKPDYLDELQQELLAVVQKYIEVDPEDITVEFDQDDEREVLEVNIVLPDEEEETQHIVKKSKKRK